MALERLQACAPLSSYLALDRDPVWLFLIEMMPDQTTAWTE
jgi:hypothetical protein